MADEQFSLVWNSFPRNLSSGLYTLLTDEQLVDVTLAAEGQILRAHKLILSVCSTYFRELFKMNSCKHPIVILKDVTYQDLSAMLRFMYQGEVNIKQEDISSFLKVAETLQIKGLTKELNEKLEDTLEKNISDMDFYLDRDKDPDYPDDIDKHTTELTHTTEKEQSRRQNISTEISKEGELFAEQTSSIRDTCHRPNHTDHDKYHFLKTQTVYNDGCESIDMPNSIEEPLDYTSSDAVNQLPNSKHEPLDYTVDTESDMGYNRSYMAEKILYNPEDNAQRQDFVPDTQLIPYSQNSQIQPFGLSNVTTYQSDFTAYDKTTSSSKGRRTVKGIPGSSLPLETTLRVVSELGPTLRVERGKVIRMYSCPWCLRHFTRKENLKLHVRFIHGPLESLTCKLCGNKYKNSNSLRVHSYLYHNAKRDKHGKPLMDGGSDDGGGDGSGDGSGGDGGVDGSVKRD